MGVQVRLPGEALSLPPPPLVNKGSVWMSFLGWLAALTDNLINRRPVLGAGQSPALCACSGVRKHSVHAQRHSLQGSFCSLCPPPPAADGVEGYWGARTWRKHSVHAQKTLSWHGKCGV